jgi:hypothetical protein
MLNGYTLIFKDFIDNSIKKVHVQECENFSPVGLCAFKAKKTEKFEAPDYLVHYDNIIQFYKN